MMDAVAESIAARDLSWTARAPGQVPAYRSDLAFIPQTPEPPRIAARANDG